MKIHRMNGRRRSRSDSIFSAAVAAVSVILLSACAGPSDREAMQGKWSGIFISETELGITGDTCGNGELSWEIVGSDLRGSAAVVNEPKFDVTATISEAGAIEGGFAVAEKNVAMFWGTFSEGGLSGEFESVMQCKGTWTAVRE